MTCSDGSITQMGQGVPHPRWYGTFPRKIHKYVIEEGILDLPTAIRSMTSLSATVMGVPDRGLLEPGKIADVVVFDLDLVTDKATYTDPHQLSEGMVYVLVNGEFAVDNFEFTDVMNGRVLRLER
jgi:N-acyl-D-aspartate/D-glutamate deacylase